MRYRIPLRERDLQPLLRHPKAKPLLISPLEVNGLVALEEGYEQLRSEYDGLPE